ncbi:MAG: signal recognition particle-docking protein FtsY [Clostridiales bacterium]|nr:signal recognition particle-docking protein FtsY [Clostridiales bacterium]
MGLFDRLKSGLKKTRDNLYDKLDAVVNSFTKIDEELFEEIEEILILSDIGVDSSLELTDALRTRIKTEGITNPEAIYDILKEEIRTRLSKHKDTNLRCMQPGDGLDIILIVGVNGTGKTTSAGKIAALLKDEGKVVMIAAADTFRAAAIEQLEHWAKRANAGIIKHKHGADPSAVVFDAIRAAKSRGADVLIIDTAGRLHTKKNLMEELKKIHRVIEREAADSRKETLIVLDATSGNNALVQAKAFGEATGIDGIVLTKMDGTAKGGIIISVTSELDVPVKFIGIGEKLDDLRHFDSDEFTEALL